MPVAKVMQPHRQTELPQLARADSSRTSAIRSTPRTPHSTLPFTSPVGPSESIAPAPLLGQHNHELLSELGLSDEEIDELEAQGVIGTAPAMHGTSSAAR